MNGKNKARKRQRGFTLIESICALALLVVVFAGFVTLATVASRLNIKSKQTDDAFAAATKTLYEHSGSEATVDIQIDGTTISVPVTKKTAQNGYALSILEP